MQQLLAAFSNKIIANGQSKNCCDPKALMPLFAVDAAFCDFM